MSRSIVLNNIFVESRLAEVLNIWRFDDNSEFSALRFKRNDYRLRAIEIWDKASEEQFFRIYYSGEAPREIIEAINEMPGHIRVGPRATDFRGDYTAVARRLFELISSDDAEIAVRRNPVLSRRSGYEGLVLPDVDVSLVDICGRTFNWKELLAIDQDVSVDNKLKEALSQSGVYLQRSLDGAARYVGSASGEGGFLGRWLRHLNSNGNAKHLNFYILENGYANILFTILEVTDPGQAKLAESRWKLTLGTGNDGPYDGLRLNCN